MAGKPTPSKIQILLARLVIILMVAFVVVGIVMNGLSVPVFERIWDNLLGRTTGPMTFRFVLQPIMATLAAFRDGVADARTGRSPYFWTILSDESRRSGRLYEGLISTARVLLLGLVMDAIYQFIVFDTFQPAESVIIAVLLAFVPYLVVRGLVTRVARRWFGVGSADETR
jgi:hypothetical protein